MTATATDTAVPYRIRPGLTGRCFVHPVFDYLLIGGGLSLLATAVLVWQDGNRALVSFHGLALLILLVNMAHFAASTVRLYTKPGAGKALPGLTAAFPLIMLAVLSVSIWFADHLGRPLQAIYLLWSPYHYAAQAYGLAVMYSFRSGCMLSSGQKRALWWVSMVPFFYMLVSAGIAFLPPHVLALAPPELLTAHGNILTMLMIIGLAAPCVLFAWVWRKSGRPMPAISLMTVIANGLWFFVLSPINAFVWATIFHGLQYMAIVLIFHARDQTARPHNRRGPVFHVLAFYAACVVLGYGLFKLVPYAYVAVGFGITESMLLTVAVINIHHFIVDGYIWRLKKTDSNRRVVDTGAAPALASS